MATCHKSGSSLKQFVKSVCQHPAYTANRYKAIPDTMPILWSSQLRPRLVIMLGYKAIPLLWPLSIGQNCWPFFAWCTVPFCCFPTSMIILQPTFLSIHTKNCEKQFQSLFWSFIISALSITLTRKQHSNSSFHGFESADINDYRFAVRTTGSVHWKLTDAAGSRRFA